MCCVCISQQENSVHGCCCKPGCPSFGLKIAIENHTSSDMHSNSRENENAALHTSQEQTKHSILHSEELESKDSLGNTDKNRLDVMLERSGDSTDDKFGLHHSRTLEDVLSIIDGDESDGSESATDSSNPSFLSTTETDPAIWELPEPADINMDSVANNDDDDEYSDGTKWGQSSCLSGFDVENGSNIKEERQKAMMEAMNGQFKILVSRFLASEDISFSEGGNGDKWLDIVASLSWEAALLIKPEASKGKAMDPGSYVKVKCVATGARTQSEVIRGLAFKKNTAHKHMPTKCKNPRLLLLKGVLGHREVGLSSFESMSEEKDGYLKSIHELITKCNPNVVLVERSVSRDMQEFLLEKGITLVFDMKLTRLDRIARCIGSPIISCTDILTCSKVKQCDMFRIEKFIEEHNCSSEGGKRSSKTLMFLEGFPKPLGCTILLKGAPIVELKKIKRVLQYTVFAAYHLILETSFFADQRALFSDMYAEVNGYLNEKTLPTNFCADGDRAGIIESYALDAPSSNGSLENSIHEDMCPVSNFNSNGSSQSPGFSPYTNSNENNYGDSVNEKINSNMVIPSDSLVLPDHPWHYMSSFSSSLKKFLSDSFAPVNSESMSSYFDFKEEIDGQNVEPHGHEIEANGGIIQEKPYDAISDIEKGDSLSSLNGTIVHNTAESNGKHEMQDKNNIENVLEPQSILVLKSSQCLQKGVFCDQNRLSRIMYYGNCDVSLGRILQDTFLNKNDRCSSCSEPPEAHVYCYTHQNGNLTVLVKELPPKSTLSGEEEGKIWMWTRCLKCKNENGTTTSTQRVVMSAAARGLSFGKFLELSFSSHSVASRLSSKCGHSLHRDCLRFFGLGSKVAMFRYSSVEIYAACKPPPVMEFNNLNGQERIKREAKSVLQKGDLLFSEVANFLQKLKRGYFGVFHRQSKNSSAAVKDLCKVEEMLNQEKSEFEESLLKAINLSGQMGMGVNEILSLSWLNQELLFELYIWDLRLQSLLQCTKDNTTSADEIQEKNSGNCDMDLETSCQNLTKTAEPVEICEINGNHQIADLHSSVENGHSVPVTANASFVQDQEECLSSSEDSCNSKTNDPNEWIWTNAVELLRDYRIDLHGGSLQKFDYVHSYTPKYLTPIKLVAQDKELLHFPLGADGGVISLFEDDISSIVSCALALYEHQYGQIENTGEKDLLEGKVEPNVAIENSVSQPSDSSITSSFWLSNGSLESEGIHPSRSISSSSSDESATSCSESSFPVDRLIDSECLHPEIPIGYGKQAARSKYSVVLVHAKEFYALRKMCCSSELAYISSLSRSKKWDAQGGKSKAFFAKTLNDRFIIKQVKKTEIDSFLKFAPDYFKHISFSIKTGSQTCLAKILGIYQVRQNRGGKEVKTDLMVMENLLFGRNFTRTYDLKGAIFSRYVSDPNDPEKKVLLDQNFMEDMRISPMYIAGRNKHLFQRAIWNDTSFLTSINVMDYSLLVGVDKQRHELVFGIIDYLRQYTWDKHLESWVKSSLVLPKNSLPTVISPKDYKNRFRKFMSKYFLTIPDAMESSTMLNGTKTSSIENLQSSQVAEVS